MKELTKAILERALEAVEKPPHHPGYGCCLTETGHIVCYEKRTF